MRRTALFLRTLGHYGPPKFQNTKKLKSSPKASLGKGWCYKKKSMGKGTEIKGGKGKRLTGERNKILLLRGGAEKSHEAGGTGGIRGKSPQLRGKKGFSKSCVREKRGKSSSGHFRNNYAHKGPAGGGGPGALRGGRG